MAEQVQAALDQMVAPLRDLLDRHIFTELEIRSIVNRRRESEYLLRRRAARKADFVRYIEAEMLLEKLRALRTARRKRDHRKSQSDKGIGDVDDELDDELDEDGNPKPNSNNNSNSKDEKDPIGDVHVVQHIHLLFVRAIRKFRGDLSLHLQHAEFCKSAKSWTRLGRVYAEALQIFPREGGIWIEAASNEFFGPNRSIAGARVLLQRALRLNGNFSEELWIQYFTLELHYAQTLKGRRKILRPDEEETSENKNSDDDNDGTGDNDDDDTKIGNNADVSDYNKIPMVILKNAIRSIPNDVQFRLKFLDACQEFPDTADLMDHVQASMARDFANEPESWIARAMYQAEKQKGRLMDEPKAKRARTAEKQDESEARDPVMAILEDATNTLQTSEMLLQAFRFAEDYRSELEHYDENSVTDTNANANAIEQVDGFIQGIWIKAKDGSIQGDPSELAIEQTRYLLRHDGEREEALQFIKDYCITNSRPGTSASNATAVPSDVWLLWASLAGPSLKKKTSILKRALQSISVDQHPDYVVVLLQYFSAQLQMASAKEAENENEDELQSAREKSMFENLQNLLLLAPKTVGEIAIEKGSTGLDFELRDVFEGYTACLDYFYNRRGISRARSVYEAVLFRSTATSVLSEDSVAPIKGFVDRCITIELEQPSEGTGTSMSIKSQSKRRVVLCKLYDKAIDIFSGTPFEASYRKDRNERAVFA